MRVAVLGLGRFGETVARELTRLGYEVLAIDSSERTVQAVADDVTHAVQADFTDADALTELGLGNFDTAIVAVSDVEASILAVVLLKRLGVRRVLAKAASELHGSILAQLGVSRVVHPEREIGIGVARSFAAPGVLDYLDVAPGYGIARVPVTEALVGRPVNAFRITPLALIRGGTVTLTPSASEILRVGDELIVAGRDEDLERLPDDRSSPATN